MFLMKEILNNSSDSKKVKQKKRVTHVDKYIFYLPMEVQHLDKGLFNMEFTKHRNLHNEVY